MILLERLTKTYGRIHAVQDVTLELEPGEVFGFLGPNGAGKTTTIRMLVGLLRPTSGRVVVGGWDMARDPVRAKAMVGYVPDRPYLYEKLTAVEFMRFLGGVYGLTGAGFQTRAMALLDQFGLLDRAGDLIQTFSHGMKQRLVMAAALLHDPAAMVVDEPMVGLDPKGARALKAMFRELAEVHGKTVFLSTHSLDVAEEVCDRLGIVHHGELVASGTLEELRRMSGLARERLEEVFLKLTEDEEAG